MPVGGEDIYRQRPSVEPHIRYFIKRCMDKGASKYKAERWAWRQVRRGKRMPS